MIKNLLLVALAFGVAPAAFAQDGHDSHDGHDSGQEKRVLLQQRSLPDAPGKQGVMATVHYEPGQASAPHQHPGSVFAYVLEGEVVTQMEGATPITYKAGDSWYESPKAGHMVSRNASASKPATLLVFLLSNEGEALTQPR
jgi:quercetin dioxygenase-like cupin family protein